MELLFLPPPPLIFWRESLGARRCEELGWMA